MLAGRLSIAVLFGGSIIVIILVLGGAGTYVMFPTSSATSNTRVAAGGNGLSWDSFSPQSISISTGDSVTWYNPSSVAEPHTVTFVFNGKSMPSPGIGGIRVVTPFAVPSSVKFIALHPGSNNAPNIIPSKSEPNMNTVFVANGRVLNPTVIDSTGSIKTAPHNPSFTITGNEQYVNSGFLFPKTVPESSNTFTATFQNEGTYYYSCLIHPWMAGSVIVK